MQEEQTKHHEWLMQLVGKWSFEHEANMGPGTEPSTMTGTEIVRPLGKLWIIAEMHSPMPDGSDMNAITTLGYDPKQGAFVGNWVGSPMTHMFIYKGHLDETTGTLTLDTTGPSFDDPNQSSEYQDIYQLISPNERAFASQVKQADGSWHRFMEGSMKRED